MSALLSVETSSAQSVRSVLRACSAMHTDLARTYADAAPVARRPNSRVILDRLAERERAMAERLDGMTAADLPWLDIWLTQGVPDVRIDQPLPALDRGPAELLLYAARIDDALWPSIRSLTARRDDPRLQAFTQAMAQLFEARRKQLTALLGQLGAR